MQSAKGAAFYISLVMEIQHHGQHIPTMTLRLGLRGVALSKCWMKKRLRGLLPFNEDTVLESSIKENVNNPELSIENTISEEKQNVQQNKSADTATDTISTVTIGNEVERNESN